MKKQWMYLLGLLLIVAVLAALGFAFFAPKPSLDLSRSYESNVFRFRYPQDWSYQIPQQNMLFLASPEVMMQQAGASMTIQRSLRLSAEADSLESALNFYLERGPLRSDRAWALVGEIEAVQFNGWDSLKAVVEGSEQAGGALMRSEIIVTRSANGNYYIFTMTAPPDAWERDGEGYRAIMASVEILE